MTYEVYNTNSDTTSFANKQWLGTKLTPRTGMIERVATNGAVRMRSTQAAPKYDMTLMHGFLSASQVAGLRTFYARNWLKPVLVTCVDDNVQRTMLFAPNPFDVVPNVDNLWAVTVYFREM